MNDCTKLHPNPSNYYHPYSHTIGMAKNIHGDKIDTEHHVTPLFLTQEDLSVINIYTYTVYKHEGRKIVWDRQNDCLSKCRTVKTSELY